MKKLLFTLLTTLIAFTFAPATAIAIGQSTTDKDSVAMQKRLSKAGNYSSATDRYDFSRFDGYKDMTRIYIPNKSGLNSYLKSMFGFWGAQCLQIDGASEILVLEMKTQEACNYVKADIDNLKKNSNYELLFEIFDTQRHGRSLAFARRSKDDETTYRELIFIGTLGGGNILQGKSQKLVALQLTGKMTQASIDSFMDSYFKN